MKCKIISKIYCWFFGHDVVETGKGDNGYSLSGGYICLRCDLHYDWQYDK